MGHDGLAIGGVGALFLAYEMSALGVAARSTAWLYPVANLLHVLGAALLVGSIAAFDIAVLRRAGAIAALGRATIPLAAVGLAVQLASGVVLLSAEASTMVLNPAFQLKAAAFLVALTNLAAFHSITPHHLIHLHTSATYSVAFIGFTPGFPYLRGLPAALATPRLPAPRPLVPAGSVAIAADQCGIYPAATPGGWRIIGRTALSLFDPHRNPPSLLAAGDNVKFVPIDLDTYESPQL